jgi:hypothetical protein
MANGNTHAPSTHRLGAAFGVVVMVAALHLVSPARVGASGHSLYSYKAGKDCRGTNNIIDPVSVEFLTHDSVGELSHMVDVQSGARHRQDESIPNWFSANALDNVKGQQGAYFRGSTRVCSSFSATNATNGALRSRYHVRFHTGGPSTSAPGFNVVAGTPHYDKLCGRPIPKHEIWTYAGARTQLARLFPKPAFRQYVKFVGNTHVRHMKCLNKDVKSDGFALFIFAN